MPAHSILASLHAMSTPSDKLVTHNAKMLAQRQPNLNESNESFLVCHKTDVVLNADTLCTKSLPASQARATMKGGVASRRPEAVCTMGRNVTCSARLAIAVMFAGRPAFTTHVTIAEGMDSLGRRLISYLSSVVVWAEGSGSTTHDPLYSCRVHKQVECW